MPRNASLFNALQRPFSVIFEPQKSRKFFARATRISAQPEPRPRHLDTKPRHTLDTNLDTNLDPSTAEISVRMCVTCRASTHLETLDTSTGLDRPRQTRQASTEVTRARQSHSYRLPSVQPLSVPLSQSFIFFMASVTVFLSGAGRVNVG